MSAERFAQTPETYDRMFREGGDRKAFHLPYRYSCYYPMYRAVVKVSKRAGVRRLLEVGCGTGGFAHMLLDVGGYSYRGFDFSQEAVRQAGQRTGRPELFTVGDATDPLSYGRESDYDAIVCTEVLEHVPDDLRLVESWPAGKKVIATVPNYDSPYHVRYFKGPEEVRQRYGRALDIESIMVVKKPYLTDLSRANYLRELRWARYRPRVLAKILGLGTIDDVGCWFLISGSARGR